jgi:hypothetical protein
MAIGTEWNSFNLIEIAIGNEWNTFNFIEIATGIKSELIENFIDIDNI